MKTTVYLNVRIAREIETDNYETATSYAEQWAESVQGGAASVEDSEIVAADIDEID